MAILTIRILVSPVQQANRQVRWFPREPITIRYRDRRDHQESMGQTPLCAIEC